MKKVLTLVLVHTDEKLLLGMKKRGFGQGRWNGFGGKVHDGEAIEDAALRELQEEAGITAINLQPRGQLLFTFDDSVNELETHIFSANQFLGTVIETDEMRPQWFSHKDIPYDAMWSDDVYWMPIVLQGKNVKGSVHFNSSEDQKIIHKSIETYEAINL